MLIYLEFPSTPLTLRLGRLRRGFACSRLATSIAAKIADQ
jgi:hypothetical protein